MSAVSKLFHYVFIQISLFSFPFLVLSAYAYKPKARKIKYQNKTEFLTYCMTQIIE